ncbi:TPA: hypothetical protein N0F65_001285 [Lagenidium giganteum]|uniref:Ubiquitin-like domain-containing protein n=1 Tax=Lagenidium giganteum TaxID=4803 RepID=A0AAV2Z1Y0_9STRA|nr:TPA: hypothetical protein N0F65_001285 [Lagenidium giganteum]
MSGSTNPMSQGSVTAAPAAAGATEGTQISLNVRMLDHSTYQISILSSASVPELKEIIANETGVVIARQRLIFRGKVLKNDQPISAYSLEDGHTLHLVVRAENASAEGASSNDTATAVNGTDANQRTAASGSRARSASDPSSMRQQDGGRRDNDEADPTMGLGPSNRVVMGAAITVPEGSDVSMPFLTSMITNMLNSVQDSVSTRNVVVSERPRESGLDAQGIPRPARVRRSRRTFRPGSTVPSPSVVLSHAGSLPSTSSLFGPLTPRLQATYESLRANIQNTDYNFAGVRPEALEITNAVPDLVFLQTQLRNLETLIGELRERIQQLPGALRDLSELVGNPTAQQPLITPAIQTIDALQQLSDYAELLSRFARGSFQESTSGLLHPGLSDRGELRATSLSAIPIRFSLPNVNITGVSGGTAPSVAPPSSASSAPAASTMASAATGRPQTTVSTSTAPTSESENSRNERSNPLFSFLERMNESIRGVTGLVSGGGANSSAQTSTSMSPPTASAARSGASPVGQNNSPPQRTAVRITSASSGGMPFLSAFPSPLSSVVFPVELHETSVASTTWNFGEFLNRLLSDMPASTIYGVMRGDATSVHQFMAQVGFALLGGVDLPPVSRSAIRTWSNTLIGEVRQQLRALGLPATFSGDSGDFVDQLVRPIEPFVPELINNFIRATTITRTRLFGENSTRFVHNMAHSLVQHLRAYYGGDDARLQQVLRDLLVRLGLDERMAVFGVTSFIEWVSQDAGSNASTSRRRPLAEANQESEEGTNASTTTPSAADASAPKRRRQE